VNNSNIILTNNNDNNILPGYHDMPRNFPQWQLIYWRAAKSLPTRDNPWTKGQEGRDREDIPFRTHMGFAPHLMDRDRTNGGPTDQQTCLSPWSYILAVPCIHVYVFPCTCFPCVFHTHPHCPKPLLYVPSERQIKKNSSGVTKMSSSYLFLGMKILAPPTCFFGFHGLSDELKQN
jgi:hypothetical protein